MVQMNMANNSQINMTQNQQMNIKQIPQLNMGQISKMSMGHNPQMNMKQIPQLNMGQIPKMSMGHNPKMNMKQIPQVMVNQQLFGFNQFPGNNQLQNSMTHLQPSKNIQPSSSKTNAYTQNPNHGHHFAPNHPNVDQRFTNQPGQLAYALNRHIVRFTSINVQFLRVISMFVTVV